MILSSFAVEAQKLSADKIKGSFLAAALGDALARNTMQYDTLKEIQTAFGAQGLSSSAQIPEGFVEQFGTDKKILYSGNTAQSLFVTHSLAEARRTSLEKELMADLQAKRLMKLLDDESTFLDPYFNQRYYPTTLAHKIDALVERSAHRVGKSWWVNSSTQQKDESDATALVRAWPVGLVFGDAPATAKHLADYLSTITHRHPKARASAAAMAVGISHALEGASVDEVVKKMIATAQTYETAERYALANAKKPKFELEVPRETKLTSELIRYAVKAALNDMPIEEVLGVNNKRDDEDNRSFRGYLLGYEADEAVAAAVYLFVKNPDSFKGLLGDGSLAVGNSALITSLAAALYGARKGYDQIIAEGFQDDFSQLEGKDQLVTAASEIYRSLSYQPLTYEQSAESAQQSKQTVTPAQTQQREVISSRVKLAQMKDKAQEELEEPKAIFTVRNAAIIGGLILAGYLIKEYVVPYVQGTTKDKEA